MTRTRHSTSEVIVSRLAEAGVRSERALAEEIQALGLTAESGDPHQGEIAKRRLIVLGRRLAAVRKVVSDLRAVLDVPDGQTQPGTAAGLTRERSPAERRQAFAELRKLRAGLPKMPLEELLTSIHEGHRV